MIAEERFELRVTCNYCGHHNQLTIATVSLPDCYLVNCSTCGGSIGTISKIRAPIRAENAVFRMAS
jgi:transcription elongation factor Elf1